jgi:hypothetical protein
MDKITILKRRLGNTLSRPFGILFGMFALGMIFSGVSLKGLIFSIIFIIGGLILGFGKEMTEINFAQQYINQYFQILFIKLNNKKTLPQIAYILVRDFHSTESYSTMSDDVSYYEISLVTLNEKKIILALYQSKSRVNKVIEQLKQNESLMIKDYTRKKILRQNISGS